MELIAQGDSFADAIALVKQFGPFFLAVVFFLWRDYNREGDMTARIRKLEDSQREIILPLVERCASVIAENSEVMKRLEKRLD